MKYIYYILLPIPNRILSNVLNTLKYSNMKKDLLFILFLISLVISWGCQKDNGTDARDTFVATYSVTEKWTENNVPQNKPAFTMTVEKSFQGTDRILLNNFANYGAGNTVEAVVNANELTIEQQALANSKIITGSGSIVNNTLTITYTEILGSVSIVVTATGNKR